MSSLPSASTRLSDQSGTAPVATDLLAVWGCCASLADGTPRLYSSVAAMETAHGYCEAEEYAAIHMEDTGKSILFVPLAIATAGTVGRFNASGNTGSSVVTCAGAGGGILAETDGVLKVTTGGTIGTDQIMLSLSLDGGLTYKPARLGTASTYTIPKVGLVLSFAAGTLVAGDTVLTWHSTAPLPDFTSLTTAYNAMVAQKLTTRSWLFVGDVSTLAAAQGVETKVNAYETSAERYTLAKIQMRDRLPLASLSQVRARMTAANITFAEVGGTGDTITRASGSFIADGFVTGDTIRVTGAVAGAGYNNVTAVPATFAASVLTMDTTDLSNEGPISGVTITSEPTLTFASGAHTITRNRGSWLDDGFRVGDAITITGTASNNFTKTITVLTATVMTFAAGVTDETIGSYGVSIVTGETDTAWIASITALVSAVTSSKRVDIGAGRLTRLSPITGYTMRRPVQWADSIRSYQIDISQTTWEKDRGSLNGWGIAGEHDERVSEGLIDARFTCARTWGNGPDGAFIAKSITRATDGSILGMTHNMYVANVAQTVCQTVTERFAGKTLVLKTDGTATPSSLADLKAKVDAELQRNLLSNIGGAGQRASAAAYTPRTDDDLRGETATLNGDCALNLKGTVVHIATTVGVS